MRKWVLLLVGLLGVVGMRAQVVNPDMHFILGRAEAHLLRDDSLHHWFSCDSTGISIYSDPQAKSRDSAEFRLNYQDIPLFRSWVKRTPFDSLNRQYADGRMSSMLKAESPRKSPNLNRTADKPLQGLRIALDPGHVGGTMEMGQLEWKYVQILPKRTDSVLDTVSFNEGNLNLATALVLDSMFRAAGATVLSTRNREGETAFGYDFPTWLRLQDSIWQVKSGAVGKQDERRYLRAAAALYLEQYPELKKDSAWWMEKAGLAAIYKGPFLRSEFEQRARLVHDFQPDLTLVIHYNVLETNEPGAKGWRIAVDENHAMAFVPGAFMLGELNKPEDRLAFLIHLVSEAYEESIHLSASVMEAHERLLAVPLLREGSHLKYIANASIPVDQAPGVYARNLALTRKIFGVVCFGESLYQDNRKECLLLNAKDFVLPGMSTPSPNRIKQVAEAYYQGVLNWALRL